MGGGRSVEKGGGVGGEKSVEKGEGGVVGGGAESRPKFLM